MDNSWNCTENTSFINFQNCLFSNEFFCQCDDGEGGGLKFHSLCHTEGLHQRWHYKLLENSAAVARREASNWPLTIFWGNQHLSKSIFLFKIMFPTKKFAGIYIQYKKCLHIKIFACYERNERFYLEQL